VTDIEKTNREKQALRIVLTFFSPQKLVLLSTELFKIVDGAKIWFSFACQQFKRHNLKKVVKLQCSI
jgi:hypothetical protein